MSAPSEGGRELAEALLASEAAEDVSVEDLVNASTRVISRLDARLSFFIGEQGFATVLARALHLAQQDYSFLGSVEVASLPASEPLPGLPVACRGRHQSEVCESVVAILGHFVDLLARFLGPDLAERLIKGV